MTWPEALVWSVGIVAATIFLLAFLVVLMKDEP